MADKGRSGQADLRKFFGSLYSEPQQLPSAGWDPIVTRLVARTADNTVVGDQALQSLLVHYVVENATSLEQIKNLGSGLAGIKQRAVQDVVNAFPKANLDQLINAARDAGYDVQVLG